LRKLFAEVGVSVDWAELHSESHSSLATHPEWIFSISHTRDSAMVWLAPSGNQIGADVEIVTREISPVAMQRLRSQRDDVRGLSAIEIWTLKEAAFKALTPKQQGDAWVFDMVIRGNEFFSPDETVAGYWRQELDQQWVRSIAWVQK
jgi:4'-phosphopantetheinyl transferase EntD